MSVSVVIPCLNEEGSIEECIRLVRQAFQHEENLEILVTDNGSTDRSREIATKAGARVVDERRRGYGAAIIRGLKEAEGEFIVIGDADNTYDFRDAVPMVEALKRGAEFAIGDRINGKPEKGSMPWLHQHIGTPILTWVLNKFYGSKVHDINCGLRAIRKDALERMKLRSPGMEFASEMVIHAQKAGLKFAEVPIRYYRRHHGQAKLRSFRDGWRHLRFILLCAPFPVFFLPSIAGMALGLYLHISPRWGFQVIGSLLSIVFFQIFIFGILAKTILWAMDSFLVDKRFGEYVVSFKLEHGILVSLLFITTGFGFLAQEDLSNIIRACTFFSMGVQIFFSSFLQSIILFKRGMND